MRIQNRSPPVPSPAEDLAPLVLALIGIDLGWWGIVVGEPHQPIARDLLRALTAPQAQGTA